MKFGTWSLALSLTVLMLAGCSLSPEEKVGREQALKQSIDSFSQSVVQGKWDDVFRMSDGGFENSDKLKKLLMKTWVQDATLTGGEIASMAWVSDTLAKVKLTWTFQLGSVETFSSETFVWGWNGSAWKYKGRSLR